MSNDLREAVQQSMARNVGSPLPVGEDGLVEDIRHGQTAMQVRSPYATAVMVQRPRSLQHVERRCMEEAAIAGDEFYYSWSQGGKVIEGLTVQAALAIARNFGNSAVDVRVEESGFAYIFVASFVDLETGFNLSRAFRQNKQQPKNKKGEDIYSGDRGQDVVFQIGQSKAIRNVVLNAMPSWLASKVMTTAKENVVEKIKKMGPEKAKDMITRKAESLGIPLQKIEGVWGKQGVWSIEGIVQISSALRAIEDGFETADSIFRSARSDDAAAPAGETEAPAAPAAQLMANSVKLLTMVKTAKTLNSLDTIEQTVATAFETGDLTEKDAGDIRKEIAERRSALSAGAAKQK